MTQTLIERTVADRALGAEGPDGGARATADVLRVEGLRVAYGGRTVLEAVDLRVAPGEVVGLIGESGSGKTSLARTVLGLVPAAAGTVEVAGQRVDGFSPSQWRRFRRAGHAQHVFQDPLSSLDGRFTALRSVQEGPAQVLGGAEASARAEAALHRVGLPERLWQRRPAQLSGGQRQRVAIARALAVDPQLLVCDEPVSALDATSRIEVVRTLADAARAGTGLLVISHDLSSLGAIADRVLVLHGGRIVEDGTALQVLTAPQHPYTQSLIAAIPTIAA